MGEDEMNALWAKQEFEKRGDISKVDLKELGDVLFTISCQTELRAWETSEYDGIGYKISKHAEYVPTALAKRAYKILTMAFEGK